MEENAFSSYARAHYFAEFERKKDLNAVLTISTGVASVIGAAIYALAFKIDVISSTVGAISFAALTASSVAFLVAVQYIIRAHVGHEYKYTGAMGSIVQSRDEAVNRGFSDGALNTATQLYIQDQYVESVGFNEQTNDEKSGLLNRANVALAWSLSILFVVGALTVISHVQRQVDKGTVSDSRN